MCDTKEGEREAVCLTKEGCVLDTRRAVCVTQGGVWGCEGRRRVEVWWDAKGCEGVRGR